MPSSSLVAEGFVSQAKATRTGLGFRNLPWATLVGHPGMQTREELQANVARVTVPEIIQNLTEVAAEAGAAEAEPGERDIVFRGGFTELNRYFTEQDWSDSLPVVPPTRDRIEAFLAHTRHKPDEVLGVLLPDNRAATIWSVAVNGVMAGCKPEYMPVLVALAQAMANPGYGVEHSGNTPGGETLIVVNGPVIQKLGLNFTQGVMRDGIHPNTTIGRFWRLYLRNVSGFLPHRTDKATFGNTWRVAIAENEEVLARIGWPTLASDMGAGAGESSVTIGRYTGGGMITSISGSTPQEVLPYVADALVKQTFWQIMFSVGTGYGRLRPLVLLTPIVVETIAAAGWSKADVKQFLFDKARMPAWEFERLLRDWMGKPIWNLLDEVKRGNIPAVYAESDDPNRMVPLVWEPGHIHLAVTGDPLRTNGFVFGQNGQLGFPVTQRIDI